jgi:hypothetical protein
MSETHHHHHHKKDGSSLFKQKSLAAIQRRKFLEKLLRISLVALAILMAILVFLAYTIG